MESDVNKTQLHISAKLFPQPLVDSKNSFLFIDKDNFCEKE